MSATAGAGKALVRLSSVPIDLRVEVADKIISRGGLRGMDALAYMLAARHPLQDPLIAVPVEKANRVLRERKQPLGSLPPVWTW